MITNKLSMLMGLKRIKMSELSRLTGLEYRTIFNLYHDKTKGIDFDTIDKICWALECTPNDLLEYTQNI